MVNLNWRHRLVKAIVSICVGVAVINRVIRKGREKAAKGDKE